MRSFDWEVELLLSVEMLFFGRGQLDVAPNLVGRLIIVTARAVQQTTRQMKHELPNRGVRPPHKNPLIEPEDPDCRVHAAWLAQVSKAGDRLLTREAGGSISVSTSSSAPADRLAAQDVRVAPAQVDRRPGLTTKILIGSILAAALAAIVGIPSYLSFFETSQQPTGDPIVLASPDPVKSATPPMQPESETPKLVVEPTLGAPGEPAPIGLALRGRSNDAVVILRGLAPGMELSAGSAVNGDSWQLSATDLPYAWIAPPKDFVGSADCGRRRESSASKMPPSSAGSSSPFPSVGPRSASRGCCAIARMASELQTRAAEQEDEQCLGDNEVASFRRPTRSGS